ncbi:MAG: glycoside hydrolase family 15 protein, partial [Proteobacteria bacterium]
MGERAFPPIADHGVVGDLSTAALVALDGSIDFLCWPRFDSPTIFAALLDPEIGGSFSVVAQLEGRVQKQMYIPDTNVLLTRTLAEAGELEVVDFLPVGEKSPRLIRVIRAVRSTVRCSVRCAPRFDYARSAHAVERDGDQVLFAPSTGPTLRLSASVPLQVDGRDASCDLELAVGETATFVLQDATTEVLDAESVAALYELTVTYWQEWSSRSTYRGRWREAVQRS